ncbi:MAG: polymerase sigma factor, sigma-70 family [Planctomycetota bacterium]|nr:polymerase sigma factor, sigma-70 family [Planctomycetota bacterium]
MTGAQPGADTRRMDRLFTVGTVAGLSDGELLGRFAGRSDEAAFEALATRHGPMVLGVCRRILDDGHAAEDAFQATFLVLVKRSGSLRDGGRLGPWLHGVARRVALRARARAVRRRDVERSGLDTLAAPEADRERAERLAVIDEEVGRLPERYRSPLILCYFEGLTHEEAARQLGCPLGTVRSRIARARDRLRDRLTRRGLVAPATLLAVVTGATASAAPVPPLLFDATSRAAMHVASGQAISAAGVSTSAAELAGEVLRMMLIHKLKVTAVVLVLMGTTLGGVAAAVCRGSGPPSLIKVARTVQAAAKAQAQGDLKTQLDAAVKAVVAVPADPNEPNNTMPNKIFNLIQLGTIQASIKDVASARLTLRHAYQAAEAIPKNSYRPGALARLARAQAAIGDAEGTRASLRMAMKDLEEDRNEFIKAYDLAAIASAQAMLHDEEAVGRTLGQLREIVTSAKLTRGPDRLSVSQQFIWSTARAGRLGDALKLVDDPPFPVPLVLDEDRLKDLDANGLEAIKRESARIYKFTGWSAIAEAIVPGRNPDDRKMLRQLHDRAKALGDDGRGRRQIAMAQARVGDIDGALETIENEPRGYDSLANVLSTIAEAQIEAGRRDAGVATLKRAYEAAVAAQFNEYKYVQFQHVALGQMKAGDFAGAVRSVEAMGSNHATDQVSYLMQIARHQEKAGDADGAAQTRARARAVAEARRKEPVEQTIPANLMVTDGKGNEINDKHMPALREDYGRGQLAQIAAALGERDEARRLADQVRNPDLKRWAQAEVPASLAASGDVAGALEATNRLESPQARLQAFSRIASALANRANATDASIRSIRP